MNLAQAVALRTSELLKKHNKSQYRLIKDTCLSKKTIQNIMQLKHPDIRLSTIYLIAEFFGMTLAEFFDCDYFKGIDIYN